MEIGLKLDDISSKTSLKLDAVNYLNLTSNDIDNLDICYEMYQIIGYIADKIVENQKKKAQR